MNGAYFAWPNETFLVVFNHCVSLISKILHFQNPVTLQVTWGQFGSIIKGDPDPMTPTTKNENYLWCGWDGAVAARVYRFCGYDENWKLYGCKESTLKKSVHDMFFWASISIVLTTTILTICITCCTSRGEHFLPAFMPYHQLLNENHVRDFVPFLFLFMPLNM